MEDQRKDRKQRVVWRQEFEEMRLLLCFRW